jgi:hypothetical protein
MEPWYKTVTPRKEVREGRSFNPDDFAIALEQVVSKKAPDDYRDPKQFFSRTCWTRALRTHTSAAPAGPSRSIAVSRSTPPPVESPDCSLSAG